MKPVSSVREMAASVWRAGTLPFVCVWNSDNDTKSHIHTHRKTDSSHTSTGQIECTFLANFLSLATRASRSWSDSQSSCVWWVTGQKSERWKNLPHSERIQLTRVTFYQQPFVTQTKAVATLQELNQCSSTTNLEFCHLDQGKDAAMSNLCVDCKGPLRFYIYVFAMSHLFSGWNTHS